jgi:ribosomal protein L29
MARFGRSFVQAATQPQYAQGLFTAAQQMGAAPGRRRQAQKMANLQKGLFGLEQSALAGDLTPEMYKEAVGSYTALMQQNPEQADEIRKSLARVGASVREQDKTQKGIGAKREINNLKNAALAVQKNRGLSTEDKEATLAKMKQELIRIQEANPNIDLTQFDGMFEDVVVEARQLNKAEDVARRDAKTRQISQALFQIKDLDALETATDKMLAGDEENAEAIKRFSALQQQFIVDKQERKRRTEERGYDVAGEVKPVRDRLEGVPKEIAGIVEDKLSAAEDEQKRYRTNGTWTNTLARKKAANLIDEAEDLINRYVISEVGREQTTIAGLESDIADLVASGSGTPNRNDIKATQNTFAIRDYGREFDELTPARKQDIQKKAAVEEQGKLNAAHSAKLSATKAQLAALRGEEPEQEEQEEAPKFIEPISKQAVQAARARGQTDKQIIDSLKALGATNDQIVSLL